MISFVLPQFLPLDGVDVPLDFPYLTAIFQGPPKHVADDFLLKHPRMERGKRAKIFAPFDALDGFSDAVKSKDVEYVRRVELYEDGFAEEDRSELARRMEVLHNLTLTGAQARKNQAAVSVTYFVPCEEENNDASGNKGVYKRVSGVCWRVDFVERTMTVGKIIIHLRDIICLDSENGIFDEEW